MLYGYGILAVVEITLLVYCVLNIVTTPQEQVRNLPKLLWLVLVLFFPLIGGVAWLVAGRPQGGAGGRGQGGGRGPRGGVRPPSGPVRPSNPDDDEDFLRQLRQRAQEQRRRARDEDTPP